MRILVVEDNIPVRETIADILQLMNHEVYYSSSAEEALELLEALDVTVDLLISDISLPGLNGCELYQQVKQLHPTCRALLTSGLPREQHDLNGVAFLQKPFTLDRLMDNVEMVQSGQSMVSLP